ncbi:MAG: prephenate dehydrogenase [Candidatus Binatia bacterium]
MPPLFERATIAGVGLIGGSLALAARAAGLFGEVVGFGRSAAHLAAAHRRGIIDRYSRDPLEAARDADLLVVAVPARAVAAVARACAPALRPGAIVSDVASVKAPVLRAVEAALPPGLTFVGAHPVAGTEESGAAAADGELFRGSRCIITPGRRSEPAALRRIRALWEGVGTQVTAMDAARHDQILAWVSHLPHALAYSAVNAVVSADAALQDFAGPSFRDLTRVAASSADMWCDVFLLNTAPLDAAIGQFIATLQELRRAIASGDEAAVRAELTRAHRVQRQWTHA